MLRQGLRRHQCSGLWWASGAPAVDRQAGEGARLLSSPHSVSARMTLMW